MFNMVIINVTVRLAGSCIIISTMRWWLVRFPNWLERGWGTWPLVTSDQWPVSDAQYIILLYYTSTAYTRWWWQTAPGSLQKTFSPPTESFMSLTRSVMRVNWLLIILIILMIRWSSQPRIVLVKFSQMTLDLPSSLLHWRPQVVMIQIKLETSKECLWPFLDEMAAY